MNARARLLPAELLTRLQRAELRPTGRVEGRFAGRFPSPLQGASVEFMGHRAYVEGDDARHFDWRVFFRTQRRTVRQYEHESNFTAHVVLDASASMIYPAADPRRWMEKDSKLVTAARLAAALGWLITARRDAISLAVPGARGEESCRLPASASPAQVERMLHVLERVEPGPGSRWLAALDELSRRPARREVILVFSDFVPPQPALGPVLHALRLRHHHVALLQVLHADELELPFEDVTLFEGLEGEAAVLTDPRELRALYSQELAAYLGDLRRTAQAAGAEYWQVRTDADLAVVARSFLAGFGATARQG